MKKLLQVPDGLKTRVLEIADKEKADFIACESCYGSCDLRIDEARKLGCKKIIHYAHNKIINSKIPVEYKQLREKYNPVPLLKKYLNKIICNKIGLVSNLQFLDSLGIAKKFLENNGKRVFIGKSKRLYKGQILGCDISCAKKIEKNVDCFLFIGSGKFHALGLVMETEKPVFVLDVERDEIYDLDEIKQKFLKQKYSSIALAKYAKTFGILISTKPGQINVKLAEKIKKRLEKNGKKIYLLVMDEIKPEKLEGIKVDAFINTACPRIAIENRAEFKKPIVNPDELRYIYPF